MTQINNNKRWPPVSGDFEVGNPDRSVAVCTLGKKIEVNADYSIIGTCKTENIGIERIIVNVISNPNIRFLILAGPEVPGHHTGSSMSSLYNNGIESDTRKIIDAAGAIPYIENVPIEAVERFREQIEFVNMMNVSDPDRIAAKVHELNKRDTSPYPEEPIWIDFKGAPEKKASAVMVAEVSLLPELGIFYHAETSTVFSQSMDATLSQSTPSVGVEVREHGTGTLLVAKESD
ncbi:MAG: tetrahydromethanopterin S-methyltransferase subunit A [Candidatus Thorarchaeota archaeon]|jgi:tetrahydromethanopterin S-methyltransferase subunit A